MFNGERAMPSGVNTHSAILGKWLREQELDILIHSGCELGSLFYGTILTGSATTLLERKICLFNDVFQCLDKLPERQH